MAYDEMGNYTGYEDSYSPVSPYDFDEEERRKEELKRQLEEEQKKADQLASEVSQKQEVVTYGDGSRTVKTTREIPAGPVAPTDYNQRIAQQESGNRPDIGYHDRDKGTAYGTYGMTAAGYEDARRVDPSLPADITQASPEQQTQAQNAYTQQNAKYLQAYGVEPTPNNLAAAHFLGAKGLSDYLKTGQISEAAAKANGGVENVKRIVNQRLGGQAAPASGATNLVQGEQGGMPTKKPQLQPVSPEAAQAQAEQPAMTGQGIKMPGMGAEGGSKPFIERYQQDQNDPNALMKLSTDENAPEWMKDRARNRAADLITQQREMQAAQEKVSTMSESELAKAMREKTTGGSWIKAIFYAAIGAKGLAQEEGAKLGLGTEKTVTGADGKAYMVKVAKNGTPLEGYSAETGKKLTAEELVNAVGSGGAGAAKWNTTAETYTDKAGNLYQKQNNERGQTRIVNSKTGEVYKGEEPLKRERDVAGQTADERKQAFKRENDATAFGNSIRKLDYDSKLKAVAEFRQAAINRGEPDLTDEELSRMGVNRPDLGGVKAQPAQAAPAQPAQAAPAAAPAVAQGPVKAPVAPEGNVPVAAVNPNAPTQPSVSGRMSVSEGKKRQEEEKSERETREAAAKKIATEAAEAVSQSPQTIVNMNKIDKAVKHLDKGTTNFGAAGGGLRKGELSGGVAQEVGRFFDTEDSRNTQDVLEAINGVVLERANLGKMTDADLKFYTAGKPTIDDSPERVKEWLETAKADIKAKLEFNKQQAASGGRKGPMEQPPTPVAPPPSIPVGKSVIKDGVTYVYDGKGWKKK